MSVASPILLLATLNNPAYKILINFERLVYNFTSIWCCKWKSNTFELIINRSCIRSGIVGYYVSRVEWVWLLPKKIYIKKHRFLATSTLAVIVISYLNSIGLLNNSNIVRIKTKWIKNSNESRYVQHSILPSGVELCAAWKLNWKCTKSKERMVGRAGENIES